MTDSAPCGSPQKLILRVPRIARWSQTEVWVYQAQFVQLYFNVNVHVPGTTIYI